MIFFFNLLTKKQTFNVSDSNSENKGNGKGPAAWVEFIGSGQTEPMNLDFDCLDKAAKMFADVIAQNPENHFNDEKGIYSLSLWDNEKKEVVHQKFCNNYPPELGKLFYKWSRK